MKSASTRLPAPPVPATADLRHFNSMPLNVIALVNSDTWNIADGWQAKAAMNLWIRAWHQVPAGSLPDNDNLLRAYAGVPDWEHCREVALRGFVKCSDGRLYHQTLCKEVMTAIARSVKAKRAIKSRWDKDKNTVVVPAKYERNTFDRIGKEKEGETGLVDRPAPRTKTEATADSPSLALTGGESVQDDWPKDFREQFWNAYPRKVEKKDAMRRLEVVRKSRAISFVALLAAVRRYATANPEIRYVKHPAVWLNKGCWEDVLPGAAPVGVPAYLKPPPGMKSLEEIRAQYQNGGNGNGENERTPVRGDAGVGEKGSDQRSELRLSGGGALRAQKLGAPGHAPDDQLNER